MSWLRLEGAEECVAAGDLARAIEARLARPVFVAVSRADLSIEGHVRRVGRDFQAEVRVRDTSGASIGVRKIEAPSCVALTEPLTVLVSLMIDPEAKPTVRAETKEEREPPIASRPANTADFAPRISGPTTDSPARDVVVVHDRSTVRGDVGPNALVSTGLLPNVAAGVGLSTLIRPRNFIAMTAGIVYWLEQDKVLPGDASARATFSLIQASGGVCPLMLESGRLGLEGCLALHTGVLRATGLGFDQETSRSVVTLHGAIELRASVDLIGPLSLHIGAMGLANTLATQRFVYRIADTSRVAHESTRLAGAFETGLRLRFP